MIFLLFAITLSVNLLLIECSTSTSICQIDPRKPLLPCCSLPRSFLSCRVLNCTTAEEVDAQPKLTSSDGHVIGCDKGCKSFGAKPWEDLPTATALCTVLDGIDCSGPSSFFVENYPCQKFNGYFHATAVLLSVVLGWVGADRLYLGHCGTGGLKLLTIGGVGMWWLADIIMLLYGGLLPADGSSWNEGVN